MKTHTPEIDKSLTILERRFNQFQSKLYSMLNAANRIVLIDFTYLFFRKYYVEPIQRFHLAKN